MSNHLFIPATKDSKATLFIVLASPLSFCIIGLYYLIYEWLIIGKEGAWVTTIIMFIIGWFVYAYSRKTYLAAWKAFKTVNYNVKSDDENLYISVFALQGQAINTIMKSGNSVVTIPLEKISSFEEVSNSFIPGKPADAYKLHLKENPMGIESISINVEAFREHEPKLVEFLKQNIGK